MTLKNNKTRHKEELLTCITKRFGEEYDAQEVVSAVEECGWNAEDAFRCGMISMGERNCILSMRPDDS